MTMDFALLMFLKVFESSCRYPEGATVGMHESVEPDYFGALLWCAGRDLNPEPVD